MNQSIHFAAKYFNKIWFSKMKILTTNIKMKYYNILVKPTYFSMGYTVFLISCLHQNAEQLGVLFYYICKI